MTTVTNATMWDRLFSRCVSKEYRGDRDAFERIQECFTEAARTTEEAWERVHDDYGELVFKKGEPVALTFDYRSPTLEVRSIAGYDADAGTITVAVGNQSFPGEVHLARARNAALLDKIDAFIAERGIAATAQDRRGPGSPAWGAAPLGRRAEPARRPRRATPRRVRDPVPRSAARRSAPSPRGETTATSVSATRPGSGSVSNGPASPSWRTAGRSCATSCSWRAPTTSARVRRT